MVCCLLPPGGPAYFHSGLMVRKFSYFVSDVHLGLQVQEPARREARFVDFLKGIPADETESLYLLGDIWDFWYEYRDVVPKGYVRVFSALMDLMDKGVKVYFFQGNHDIWSYSYFEDMGMVRLTQPYVTRIGRKSFCLGHGDGLGPSPLTYRIMRWTFHNPFVQKCFSALHPWFAFRLGNGWSRSSRLAKSISYPFRGMEEPICRFCRDFQKRTPVDFYIFGHYHSRVDMGLDGARLMILGDWITGPNWIVFDRESGELRACQG